MNNPVEGNNARVFTLKKRDNQYKYIEPKRNHSQLIRQINKAFKELKRENRIIDSIQFVETDNDKNEKGAIIVFH